MSLVMLIYVAWDKRLAMRVSCVVLVAMSLNDILKLLIANPRPFLQDGTYLKKWAVSPARMKSLAAEFSTPSGHAVAAASFYSYLCVFVTNRWFRAGFVLVIVLIGCSRPYLGVHYVEDVLIGWALGLGIALVGARYSQALSAAWWRLPFAAQIAMALVASVSLYFLAVALDSGRMSGQAVAVLGYTGFLTGTVIGRPLELRVVGFDPWSGGVGAKVARFVFTLGVIGLVLLVARELVAALGTPVALPGYLVQYLGYVAAGVAGMFVAPLLFMKMGMAEGMRG